MLEEGCSLLQTVISRWNHVVTTQVLNTGSSTTGRIGLRANGCLVVSQEPRTTIISPEHSTYYGHSSWLRFKFSYVRGAQSPSWSLCLLFIPRNGPAVESSRPEPGELPQLSVILERITLHSEGSIRNLLSS